MLLASGLKPEPDAAGVAVSIDKLYIACFKCGFDGGYSPGTEIIAAFKAGDCSWRHFGDFR